ncbi:hypothetical protein EDC94DRAFT_599184 [Helicostylum pulchrum]|nr:hypothetical protein EDC94DRAFT_599184 [Helicostylum pulchrum]
MIKRKKKPSWSPKSSVCIIFIFLIINFVSLQSLRSLRSLLFFSGTPVYFQVLQFFLDFFAFVQADQQVVFVTLLSLQVYPLSLSDVLPLLCSYRA